MSYREAYFTFTSEPLNVFCFPTLQQKERKESICVATCEFLPPKDNSLISQGY